ncbi:DUF1566 domain-containing protein [Parabacteroides gordonii]|uniref:Lcl domain-containing protein n=1 Tax=Parabacteroides gordonii TaxID=574930 RepID=UPI0026EF97CF|nr:DUF1566 domain-containing protein [Parabacteroides gordonii]
MISKSFITAIILCLLPAATAFGQVLKKEKLIGTDSSNPGINYAVFYASGMPESAIWPLGMNLMANKATIRHTQSTGNGNNIPVNDKVPYRFIIAPKDGGSGTWAAAMGLNTSANIDLSADGVAVDTGCAAYSTTEFPTGWRLPTQREMMLMWLFRDGINAIYDTAKLQEEIYWTATESDKNWAWRLNFSSIAPESNTSGKGTSYKYRCVRDY